MAFDAVMEATGGQATNLAEAEILGNTIAALVRPGPNDDLTLITNGIEVTKKATEALEVNKTTAWMITL